MFFTTLFVLMTKFAKLIVTTFLKIKESKFIKSIFSYLKKVNVLNLFKSFFGEHMRTEKYKIAIALTSFIFLLTALLFFGSIQRIAVYVDGEKIGYVQNEDEAKEMIDEYNKFNEANHGNTDIILQNEISLSNNLLNKEALQQVIDTTRDEEFSNAYLLYIDNVFVTAVENSYALRTTISKLENDVSEIFGYSAALFNNIEIKNDFYPTTKLTPLEDVYASICGTNELTKENVTPSIVLGKDNEPLKLYSVNGVLFELYEFYEEERIIPHETIEKEDSNIYEYTQMLEVEGSDGSATDMYKRTIFEGEEQSSELLYTTVTKEKVDTVIVNGTKQINWSEKPKVLLFPLLTDKFNYSSDFGYRVHPIDKVYSFHNAVDLGVPTGTSVIACSSGVVTKSSNSGGDAGIFIEIKHDNGLTTRYLHLSKRLVEVGDRVYAGQQIALSGNTGKSTGPHLHFTVLDTKGNAVHPKTYTQWP